MYRFLFVFFIFIIAIIIGCSSDVKQEKPIATVKGKYNLYMSDISDILHPDMNKEDSAAVISDYATRWIKTKLVLLQAENNLPAETKDVTEELEDYKASLLIFRYEQAYISQKMDTSVTAAEIKDFYEKNLDNFQLTSILIKGLYIKVANDVPALKKIQVLYKSDSEKDFDELEKLCSTQATKFDTFGDEWIDFNVLMKELPPSTDGYENLLIKKRIVESSDDHFTYLLRIKDIKTKGSPAPLEHVEENIKTIILNRKKTEMINKLENEIFNLALRNNDFKIYLE